MAGPLYYDRVKETTTTTGTGTYTLAGAIAGFQSFSVVGDGNTCYYAITDNTDWEVGLGTYTSAGTTLARTTVLASSNGGSAVSWAAGTKTIWLDAPALTLTGLVNSASALSPAASDGHALGTTALQWSDLFGASGFVFNLANGDWVATHTAGVLTVGTGDLRVTTAGTNTASVVTVGGTQTLTSKTMTSPTLNTPTVGTTINPTANDAAALGASGTAWSDLFLASGAVIDIAAGNWVATHTSGILTVGTGDLRVTTAGTNSTSVVTVGGTQTLTSKTMTSPVLNTPTVGTTINPTANDAAALGASGTAWSDLFLASGAVINFAAGNWVATHTSGILTVGTGDLRVTTAGTNTASVVTVGGTQTLTSKTLTSPTMTTPTLGAATATSLTFSPTTGGIVGTTTNDNTTAGDVGELIESEVLAGSAVSLTTNTTANVTSIPLTAGDWDVWGSVVFSPNALTTVTAVRAGIGTTSATFATRPAKGAGTTIQATLTTGVIQEIVAGQLRLSVASTTTVYLLALSTFATNTQSAFGYIGARRRR